MQYLLGGITGLGGKATDSVVKSAIQKIDSALLRAAASTGIHLVGEGAEEYLQEILEPVYRNLCFGEKNEFRLVSEAAAYDALVGMLVAGVAEAGNGVSTLVDEGWADVEGPSVRGLEEAGSVDISGESGIIEDTAWKAEVYDNLDLVIEKPEILQSATPEEWYSFLQEASYEVKPLGNGQLKGIAFEDGGGFRINWSGDRILQYHPPGGHHGGGAYWKISSGATGSVRFDMFGNIMP